ncbi:MAG: hypothetical protein ACR2N4_14270 [Jatrophihabitans sp.]
MPTTTGRRVLCLAAAVLLASGLAGCSSSSKDKGSFPTALPSTDSTSTLSKTDFLARMNAVCSAIDAQRKALPTPAGLTDYPNIAANLSGTLRILPAYLTQAEVLVRRSADKAELTSKWIAVEQSDFATIKPIAERMVADSTAKDEAKVSEDGEELSTVPDHSSTIADYLTGYGLTSCASLERD